MEEEKKNEGSLGPVVGLIIILLLIILGGLYFWGERAKRVSPVQDESALGDDQAIQEIKTQSSSDATTDIEADLNATNVDSIDANL